MEYALPDTGIARTVELRPGTDERLLFARLVTLLERFMRRPGFDAPMAVVRHLVLSGAEARTADEHPASATRGREWWLS